jgi:hypothetical protein
LHIHELQKIGPERILQKRSPQAALETGPRGFLIEGIRAIAEFRGLLSFLGLDFLGRDDLRFYFGMRATAAISFRGQNLSNAWFTSH